MENLELTSEKYDVIIGLEIHTELKTKSKMFCACDNDSHDKEPNINTCPICLGHPGTLPLVNQQAIEWIILLGLALDCQINKLSKFDRKNYFYPDLPKGYQISQYDLPLCHHGKLAVQDDIVEITRIHLEEDTGKLSHPEGKDYSLVDYNRAGTPLVELVTEPVIKSAQQAKEFCQKFQQILRYLNISNADMEKGEMRCEANVSVQLKDSWKYEDGLIKPKNNSKLNPKVEVKNINSFKSVEKAINYEVKRQIAAIEAGEELVSETRGWNDPQGKTIRQRIKESSADYRYFPEPDIAPLNISDDMIREIECHLTELPDAKVLRFQEEYNFSEQDALWLTTDKATANYTEQVISELRAWIDAHDDDWERQKHKLAKIAANWIISELFKHLKINNQTIDDIKISPENFAELVTLVHQDKITSTAGQAIFEVMYKTGGDPTNIMQDLGLEQVNNEAELEETILEIIKNNPTQAAEYKAGKEALMQFFIGKVMAQTRGKANPKVVVELLKKNLSK